MGNSVARIVRSRSVHDTAAVAARFARAVRPKSVIGLVGGLGAGKTVFARAFARALGVRDSVSSPTFIVAAAHALRNDRIATLYHIDCYRLRRPISKIDRAALHEAFDDPFGVTIIEWADRIAPLLSRYRRNLTMIRFRDVAQNARDLSVRGALAGAMRPTASLRSVLPLRSPQKVGRRRSSGRR